MRSFGPRVYQDRLDLYLAPQAFELRVLGKRRSCLTEADGVVDSLVALLKVFIGGVMNARVVPVDLEVLRDKTRVEELLYVSVGIEDQPSTREVLDFIFNGR